MFSNAAEYAIKACIWIANNASDKHLVKAVDLAEATSMPKAFIAKILQSLSKKNIVTSVKGPNGGFYIYKNQPEQISIYSIVEAVDGNSILHSCVLGIKVCSDAKPCPAHEKYKPIRLQIANFLLNTNLKELAEGLKAGHAYLSI